MNEAARQEVVSQVIRLAFAVVLVTVSIAMTDVRVRDWAARTWSRFRTPPVYVSEAERAAVVARAEEILKEGA